jgi:hypothetical protein
VNIVVSLDYEIYFGKRSGSVERSLIEPTNALCDIALRNGIVLVFFVDIGYLLRLKQQARQHPALEATHDSVMRQLDTLVSAGHELHLHVHPHWEDSVWTDGGWRFDMRRYRLHDFSDSDIAEIISRYTQALRTIAGDRSAFAFRAGGWCIQPFYRLREPLRRAGILIDSTVYANGRQDGDGQRYDFTQAPCVSRWRFEHDPLQIDPNGSFLELPIASHTVTPDFYWKLGIAKKLNKGKHRPMADGSPLPLSRADFLRKLFLPTASVVSIDGFKASLLAAAFQAYQRRQMSDLVIIGHPKAFTRFSLQTFDNFTRSRQNENFVGFAAYK